MASAPEFIGSSLKPPPLHRALLGGSALLTVEGFVLDQGMLAFLVAAGVLLIGVPRTFLLQRFAPVRRARLRNSAIYLVAVALAFIVIATNNRIARNRAEMLVTAIESWHRKHQRYPESLEEIVPDFIPNVPLAKYNFGFNQFVYSRNEGDATLYYVAVPPFGRPFYDFASREWKYLD